MSEIENSSGNEGLTEVELLLIGGGAYALKALLGPTLDRLGEELRDLIAGRISAFKARNTRSILEKAHRMSSESEMLYPSPRTVARIMDDASLYDDDLMQTYVAGLLAASRNEDGSDDRPVFYLTLIDGLSAKQLQTFHALYSAAAQLGSKPIEGRFEDVTITTDDFSKNMATLTGEEPETSATSIPRLIALESAQLIRTLAITDDEGGEWRLKFGPTRLGALLFDWVHGFDDENLFEFPRDAYPDIGLPTLRFTPTKNDPQG